MSRKKVEERDTSGDVPGYIVTFSDMVTDARDTRWMTIRIIKN